MTDPIAFSAVVNKVQTLADGGLRATFDLPETAIMQAAELMAVRQAGCAVDVTVVPNVKGNLKSKIEEDGESNGSGGLETGRQRKSNWKAAKE